MKYIASINLSLRLTKIICISETRKQIDLFPEFLGKNTSFLLRSGLPFPVPPSVSRVMAVSRRRVGRVVPGRPGSAQDGLHVGSVV